MGRYGADLTFLRPFFTFRHFPVPLLKTIMVGMAAAKLNVLHLHATDSESFPLVLASQPLFASKLSFSPRERYTKADVRRLTAFAKDRGVRVYLELDIPSHTGDFLSDGWWTSLAGPIFTILTVLGRLRVDST